METNTTEIAPGIHRLSTYVAEVAPPAGFTFNQFLIDGDEPFLFHTGMRGLFPLVSGAVDRVVGLERLRWISFAHVEADECGAMNLFLAASPDAQVIHGDLACSISLDDLADRPPVRAGDDPLDIGGHRLRFLPTPHVPHNWESGLWFDETTRTLLAGDLFTSLGDGPPIVETSLVEGALIAEDVFHQSSISPMIPATLRSLAELEPTTIACMHGSSFRGDGGSELRALADAYDAVLHGVAA
jgi:flavorubredoxin